MKKEQYSWPFIYIWKSIYYCEIWSFFGPSSYLLSLCPRFDFLIRIELTTNGSTVVCCFCFLSLTHVKCDTLRSLYSVDETFMQRLFSYPVDSTIPMLYTLDEYTWCNYMFIIICLFRSVAHLTDWWIVQTNSSSIKERSFALHFYTEDMLYDGHKHCNVDRIWLSTSSDFTKHGKIRDDH